MRNTIKYGILGLALLFSVAACEDILDPKIDNQVGDKDTWRLPEYASGVLYNAYNAIPGTFDSYNSNFLDAATDNATTSNFSAAIGQYISGGMTPQTNFVGDWVDSYNQFRNIHLFMENGLGSNVQYDISNKVQDSLARRQLKGEAYFLRAWWGMRLLQDYGGKANDGQALGYTIIKRTLTSQEAQDFASFRRNTYEECVAQILSDCDSAALLLPKEYVGNDVWTGITNVGKGTSLAALAIKSRATVYAASPANQPDNITSIDGMGKFTVKDQAAYLAKWVRAAQLGQQAITAFGTYNALKAANFNVTATPKEFIFRKYANNRSMEQRHFPPLLYGTANTVPTQNLVDAFPMANGLPITDPASGYDPANPYANRDPRMAQTLYWDGSKLGAYTIETQKGGKDAFPANYEATRTGYYVRKWLSADNTLLDIQAPKNAPHYHAMIRGTELYLNLAEAANEAFGPAGKGDGVTLSALEIIKIIRKGAGINNDAYLDAEAAKGKDAFRTLIQNERRIELAFENHRYFDMRRWLLPLNEPIYGAEIVKSADGKVTLTKKVVAQNKLDNSKYYYSPLPLAEMVRNPNFINNKGW